MASPSLTNHCKLAFLSSLLLISAAAVPASAYHFHHFNVGGERGWVEPTGNETETYNEWATRNRFHIGDSINFEYENDSVVEVDKRGYQRCNMTNPISEYEDGNTIFEFNHYGFFYFISGRPGHCESGQRLIIRVMVHPEVQTPAASPPEGPPNDGGNKSHGWSRPLLSSATKLPFELRFIAALGGVLLTLY